MEINSTNVSGEKKKKENKYCNVRRQVILKKKNKIMRDWTSDVYCMTYVSLIIPGDE